MLPSFIKLTIKDAAIFWKLGSEIQETDHLLYLVNEYNLEENNLCLLHGKVLPS